MFVFLVILIVLAWAVVEAQLMVKVTFCRRSWLTGWWMWPETVTLPREGARLFCRNARHSHSHKILRCREVRR